MPTFVAPVPSPRQEEFFCARSRFVAYGGSRGGGKSWGLREKAILLALAHPGIRILIVRRTYPELRENHILPLMQRLMGIAQYKDVDKSFTFPTRSRIVLGYCDSDSDVLRYQGQEYDVVMIDEATQLTEYQYSTLTACVRGANTHPKRMYLTCNPGGVGHAWVKRLFIDREYRGDENPDDYTFIPARVTDNPVLMEHDPGYVRMLRNLPPGLREAWLEGRWDVYAGQYFTEWDRDIHVVDPVDIPAHWRKYVAMDYGLDMLAAYLIAVDEQGVAYVCREVYEGRDKAPGSQGVIISDAARMIREMVGEDDIYLYLAPPDLWNARQETGKSVAQLFLEQGISLTKASADRIDGWMAVHEWLKVIDDVDGKPTAKLRIFRGCENLIRCMPLLQYDDKKPNDVALTPHEITHGPDALRYFCVYYIHASKPPERERREWTPAMYEDYRNARNATERQMLINKWGRPLPRKRG